MKQWFFDTFMRGTTLHAAYRVIDHDLSEKYPRAWPRILAGLKGWKLVTGLLLVAIGPGAVQLAELLTTGGYSEHAARVPKYAGIALMVVGVIHKVVRIILYEEATDADGFLDEPNPDKPEWLTTLDGEAKRPVCVLCGKPPAATTGHQHAIEGDSRRRSQVGD